METGHQICIIFMLIIIVSAGESGLSAFSGPPQPAAEQRRGSEGCNLKRWEGSWFQSGVHQTIIISRNAINTKGRCLEAEGEKYLLHNERDNCFRCVVFHEKHYNLLQYKETFCISDRAPIKTMCSTITADANLFAMFRLNATPIECPFRAPFSFSYRGNGAECLSPESSVVSCLHPSKLLFNYEACPDVPGTESRSEEMHCLASFREGSFRFLVGLMQYRHHASFEERFRCFAYEKVKKGSMGLENLLGPGYSNTVRSSPLTFNSTSSSDSNSNAVLFRVSQSGDATCNGLTPYEGSRTLTFRRAPTFLQPPKQCFFPSWLQVHPRWHTLDQRTVFSFNSSLLRIANTSGSVGDIFGNDPNLFRGNSEAKIAVCSQIVEKNPSVDEYMIVLHITTSQCRNGYICSRILRRDVHIVEMQMGALTRQADEACHSSNFNSQDLPYLTLTPVNAMKKQCPPLGHFGVTSLAREGRTERDTCQNGHISFSVGCSNRNTLEFRILCGGGRREVFSEYACHGWWEENGINYLITTMTSRSSSPGLRKYCFIYRDMPIPLESKAKGRQEKLKLRKSFLDEEEDLDIGDHDFGRIIQFSSLADSCRRDVSPGIQGFLAFNGTSTGRCSNISGSSIPRLLADLWLLATIIQMVMVLI